RRHSWNPSPWPRSQPHRHVTTLRDRFYSLHDLFRDAAPRILRRARSHYSRRAAHRLVGLGRRHPLRPLLYGRVSRSRLDSFPPSLPASGMNLAAISPILFIAGAFTLATILDPIWSSI